MRSGFRRGHVPRDESAGPTTKAREGGLGINAECGGKSRRFGMARRRDTTRGPTMPSPGECPGVNPRADKAKPAEADWDEAVSTTGVVRRRDTVACALGFTPGPVSTVCFRRTRLTP